MAKSSQFLYMGKYLLCSQGTIKGHKHPFIHIIYLHLKNYKLCDRPLQHALSLTILGIIRNGELVALEEVEDLKARAIPSLEIQFSQIPQRSSSKIYLELKRYHLMVTVYAVG
jgi:hypothetical protein